MPEITDKRIQELLATCRACDRFHTEKQQSFYRDVETILRDMAASEMVIRMSRAEFQEWVRYIEGRRAVEH